MTNNITPQPLKATIIVNGEAYKRQEVTTSIRTANQYLSNQATYGRRHEYIMVEYCGRLGLYRKAEVAS